jgi:outer membrane lipoprotein SlyB
MASSIYPQQPQAQTNRLGQAIGGAGLGYMAGNFLGGSAFGVPSQYIGAGLGALGGYFL